MKSIKALLLASVVLTATSCTDGLRVMAINSLNQPVSDLLTDNQYSEHVAGQLSANYNSFSGALRSQSSNQSSTGYKLSKVQIGLSLSGEVGVASYSVGISPSIKLNFK